jgi:hypothetical protein
METDFTRRRLSNKAHIFGTDDTVCARCGVNVAEALDTPFRCAGEWAVPPATVRPMTLTAALDSAEDHIIARRIASAEAANDSERFGPAAEQRRALPSAIKNS